MRTSRNYNSRTLMRTETGSMAALIPAAFLIAIIGVGAFALDISHNVTVRTELQNASDAAALAGARELLDKGTEKNAESSALQVAEQNAADGREVSNSADNTEVTVQTMQTAVPSQYSCTVSSDMGIQNIFARIFGSANSAVTTKSYALASRTIIGVPAGIAFPLAVSVDTTNGGQKALFTKTIGDEVRFEINSQQVKNAAWTSFDLPNTNANWLNDAIDELLGISNKSGDSVVPAFDVGDDLNLTNGVASQKDLAKEPRLSALIGEKNLVIPLMTGEPPYNQSRKCVGFITVDVTDVLINQSGGQVETIVGIIKKGIINRASPGTINSTNDGTVNTGIQNISPGVVKLVSEEIAMNGIPNTVNQVDTANSGGTGGTGGDTGGTGNGNGNGNGKK